MRNKDFDFKNKHNKDTNHQQLEQILNNMFMNKKDKSMQNNLFAMMSQFGFNFDVAKGDRTDLSENILHELMNKLEEPGFDDDEYDELIDDSGVAGVCGDIDDDEDEEYEDEDEEIDEDDEIFSDEETK